LKSEPRCGYEPIVTTFWIEDKEFEEALVPEDDEILPPGLINAHYDTKSGIISYEINTYEAED
jgi:hypothetical protein